MSIHGKDADVLSHPLAASLRGVCRVLHLHPIRAVGDCRGQRRDQDGDQYLDYVSRKLAISYLDRGDLAHVELGDLLTNAAGKGEAELTLNGPGGDDLSEAARSTSSGYVRSKLTVLHGGADRAPAAEFKPVPAKAGGRSRSPRLRTKPKRPSSALSASAPPAHQRL